MRRPVGVKSILFLLGETSLFSLPSGHCRHASIRTLEERFVFARCMLGVLVTAGAAICLSPCGSALAEWNLGQAINAVTGTRLWALSFSLPGTVLIFVFVFRSTRLPPLSFGCCCAMVRTLLRSPTDDAATPPAFSPSPRSLASSRFFHLVPPTSVPNV